MDQEAAIRASRCHHYNHLIKRWRSVARRKKLSFTQYGESDGFPVYVAESRTPSPNQKWAVLSTGIHGDEPAGTEGVLEWAEQTSAPVNLLIFPCLNPWGLVNNSRLNARGKDLNRTYKVPAAEPTRSHIRLLAGRRFDLALTLHEDYDAAGIYLYEIAHTRPYWGEDLIEGIKDLIAPDSRSRIETSHAKSGVIRRKLKPDTIDIYPEALFLHFNHANRTYTFETPSEFSLKTRIAAQVRFIDLAIDRLTTES